REDTMSHQSHDVFQGHYLLRWAETHQATMRRRAAEAHLAQQVRVSQPVGLRPVAVLQRVGTQLWVIVRMKHTRILVALTLLAALVSTTLVLTVAHASVHRDPSSPPASTLMSPF